MQECGNAGIPELRTTYYVPRFLIRSLIRECGSTGTTSLRNAGMQECRNTGTMYLSNTVSNSVMRECGNTYHVLRTKVSNTVSNSGMRECRNAGIPELHTMYYVPRFLIRSLIGECGNAGIPELRTTYYVPRFLIRSLIRECGNVGIPELPPYGNTVSNLGMRKCGNVGMREYRNNVPRTTYQGF